MNCQHCGAEAAENMALCPDCGNPVENPVPRKRKKRGFVIGTCIIAGVLAVMVALWLIHGFGPAAKLAKALGNTLQSGSFTAHYTGTTRYGSKEYSAKLTCKATIDFDTQELTLIVFARDGKIKYAIYEGFYLACRNGNGSYAAEYVGDLVQRFFDAGDSLEELNPEQLLQDLDIADKLETVMSMEEMERAALRLLRDLNSRSWLRKNAGFSQSWSDFAVVYTFQPELPTLTTAVISEFEDAFYNAADYQKTLEEASTHWEGQELALSVGLRGGKLSKLEYSVKDDRHATTMQIEFTDIGKTNIDADIEVLKEILAASVK